MNELMTKLLDYGADIDGAMGRFLDDVDLYKICFASFLEDEAFPQLEEALATQDYAKAFECAHTLKGVTGNMGLTPLYQVICAMVEALRRKDVSHLQEDYANVLAQLAQLRAF